MPRKKAADAHDMEDIIQEGCRILAGQEQPKYTADLQDVAQSLGLLTTGSKKDLLERITHHFDENPILRNTPRYEGLFSRLRRRPARDENTPNMNVGTPAGSRSSNLNLPPLSSNIANISHGAAMKAGPSHAMFTFNAPGPSVSYYPPLYSPMPYSFSHPPFLPETQH
jgi:hypothetical protein